MVPFMRGCLTNARSDETLEQVINELQTFLDEAPDASDEVRAELGALLAEALAYAGDRAGARAQIAAVAATISDDTDLYAAYAVADNRGLVALLELDLDQGRSPRQLRGSSAHRRADAGRTLARSGPRQPPRAATAHHR